MINRRAVWRGYLRRRNNQSKGCVVFLSRPQIRGVVVAVADVVLGEVLVGGDLSGLERGSRWYVQLTCIHTIVMKANGFKSMASS